jgi:hypothetical protein
MIDKLLDGIEGKLTSSKWAKMAKTSQDTAGRDIAGLLRDNALVKEPGGGRSTSYAIVATPADVLRVMADYVRGHRQIFAREGRASPSAAEREERAGAIADLAGRIDALAASKEAIRYQDFEPILGELHASGFYPDNQLVAAFAFVARNAS